MGSFLKFFKKVIFNDPIQCCVEWSVSISKNLWASFDSCVKRSLFFLVACVRGRINGDLQGLSLYYYHKHDT